MDKLTDGAEVNKHKTDPLNEDTDGGTIDDGTEVNRGTDPLNPDDPGQPSTTDGDNDGMDDQWEIDNGFAICSTIWSWSEIAGDHQDFCLIKTDASGNTRTVVVTPAGEIR